MTVMPTGKARVESRPALPQGPLARYRADLSRGRLEPDPAQEQVAGELERLYQALVAVRASERGWLGSLGTRLRMRPHGAPRGLYLWGGVGRGKTYLVDSFFGALPLPGKQRIHFHHFMRTVHTELKDLGGRRDPLKELAARIARATRVLCCDEFHVTDITDAMLLARLLGALFARGITLVSTSNVAPDDLYLHGLQRDRFLPAIELIKQHQKVVHLGGALDYRLRALDRAEVYFCPHGEEAEEQLRCRFHELAGSEGRRDVSLRIEARVIPTVRRARSVVWFTFEALCGGPRAVADYIEIARTFPAVLISAIPCMDDAHNDKAMRFIRLIDELYDRSVKIAVSAAAPPHSLYRGQRLAEAFRRTASRIEEMRTRHYLDRPHCV